MLTGLHSLSSVSDEVTPGCCRQIRGHCDFWFRHHASRLASVTVSGSMVYWAWDRTEKASTPKASTERIVMDVMEVGMVEEKLENK
jgi:hypothetical protein